MAGVFKRPPAVNGQPSVPTPATSSLPAFQQAINNIRSRLEKLDAAVNRAFTTIEGSSSQRDVESLQNQIAILSKDLENLTTQVAAATGNRQPTYLAMHMGDDGEDGAVGPPGPQGPAGPPGGVVMLDGGECCGDEYPLGFPSSPTVFADPTASISFTAVAGTEVTAMRSDAAPALATTLVTLGTDSFSLSTASDLGDPATRGSITFTAGDNDTFVGSSLVIGGAGGSGGVLNVTAGGAMTLAAGTTATVTAASLTATTTGDMTLTVGGSFTATTDVAVSIGSGEEMSLTAVDSITMLAGVDFVADAGGGVSFSAAADVDFSSTGAAVRMSAGTAVRLSAQTGITLTTGAASEAEFAGEVAITGRQFGNPADAKLSVFSASVETTDATPTEVETTTGGFIVLTNDSSYVFTADVAARNTGNDAETAAFTLQGVIRRGTNAASTTVVGTPVLTVLAQDTGTTTWTCAFAADTTNGRPAITVTGEAAKNIRWTAGVAMTKVSG